MQNLGIIEISNVKSRPGERLLYPRDPAGSNRAGSLVVARCIRVRAPNLTFYRRAIQPLSLYRLMVRAK